MHRPTLNEKQLHDVTWIGSTYFVASAGFYDTYHANTHDFTWVDPLPDDIIKTPPALSFTVNTAKFQGRVTVIYERADDLYVVELRCGEALIKRVDSLFFDSPGETLESLIDDGHWRKIRVEVMSDKCKPIQH